MILLELNHVLLSILIAFSVAAIFLFWMYFLLKREQKKEKKRNFIMQFLR